MGIKVTKPEVNIREKLNELTQEQGIKGTEILRADDAQTVRNAIGAGRKNLIINGGMQHWQRSTSASVSSSNGNSYLACDRWMTIFDAPNSATATISQSTDVPSGQGFKYSQLHTVTATDTVGLNAFRYIIEGYDHLNLLGNWVTASFWFKSSVAGNYSYNHHVVSNGGVIKQFSYPTANVWQKVEITYYVPEGSIYQTTNGIGSRLYVVLGVNSVYSSTSEYPNWNGSGATKYGVGSNQVALNTISGATAQITGVQLEVGSVATDFEHRSYGEELALCQRYYQALGVHEIGATRGSEGTYSGSENILFPVRLRTTPTLNYNTTYSANGSCIGVYASDAGLRMVGNCGGAQYLVINYIKLDAEL